MISESLSPCIDVKDFTQFNDGLNNIFVVASREGCKSGYSSVESFIVNKVPERTADAGEDVYACSPDKIPISAIPDPEGSGRHSIPQHLSAIQINRSPMFMIWNLEIMNLYGHFPMEYAKISQVIQHQYTLNTFRKLKMMSIQLLTIHQLPLIPQKMI